MSRPLSRRLPRVRVRGPAALRRADAHVPIRGAAPQCAHRSRPSRVMCANGSYWKWRIAFRCVILSISSSGTSAQVLHRPSPASGATSCRSAGSRTPSRCCRCSCGCAFSMPTVSSMKHVITCSLKTSDGSRSPRSMAGPVAGVLVDVVDPLEEVRDPADTALGQRDAQLRELPKHRAPHDVGGGLDQVDRRQRVDRLRSALRAT